MHSSPLFISGIGTDVGKTIVSAIYMCGLQSNYWKPLQAGIEPETDTQCVQRLTGLPENRFMPEYRVLKTPASPHWAAELEGIEIDPNAIQIPESNRPLLIEGAGGILVPIHHQFVFADWIQAHKLPVLLVSKNYLGSINHTLMTIEVLRNRNIPIEGVVFSGAENTSSEKVIALYGGVLIRGHIPFEPNMSPEWIQTAYQKYIS
jgi:dethiobiotin synthetase